MTLSFLNLLSIDALVRNPVAWLLAAFALWMLVDAIRRGEWLWAVFIFLFPFLNAVLYFFLVYRQQASATRGFELPGAHDRRRIKELEAQIHHLDKAHHHSQLGDIYFQQGKQLAELYARQGQNDRARAELHEVLDDTAHAPAFSRKRERPWIRRARTLMRRL